MQLNGIPALKVCDAGISFILKILIRHMPDLWGNYMVTSKTSWKKGAIIGGILPATFLFLFMGLGPSVATFLLSFTDISGLPNIPFKFVGLANYKEFFFLQNYRDTLDALKRTILFALLVTFLQNGAGLLVAIALNNRLIRGRNFFRAVIFLPVVLGVMVTALCWNLFFGIDGPASIILKLLGSSSAFFADRSIAFYLVIFCQCWMAMGTSMVIFLAGLQGIPKELYEAGDIDGANSWQTFSYITLPLLWSTISVNVLLAIIGSLSTFQMILFTTGGDFDTSTLAMRIFNSAFGVGRNVGGSTGVLRQGYAAAQSMVLFVFVLAATLLSQHFMSRKERDI
jgi:ABC-type sugar transport system permease subunit